MVPYVAGRLDPRTAEACAQAGLPTVWCQLSTADEYGYGRLFRNLWAGRRTFMICEHDVVPTVAQFHQMAWCGHGWCSYQYDNGMYPVGPMFGLVRFDRTVLEAHPFAAEVALITGRRRDELVEWWRVDSMVARDLMIRQVVWEQHDPAVVHHHVGAPSGPP